MTSNTHSAFIFGGLIYSIKENFDIDVWTKAGLSRHRTGLTLLEGVAL